MHPWAQYKFVGTALDVRNTGVINAQLYRYTRLSVAHAKDSAVAAEPGALASGTRFGLGGFTQKQGRLVLHMCSHAN